MPLAHIHLLGNVAERELFGVMRANIRLRVVHNEVLRIFDRGNGFCKHLLGKGFLLLFMRGGFCFALGGNGF